MRVRLLLASFPARSTTACGLAAVPLQSIHHRRQPRHAFGDEARLCSEDVASLQTFDVPVPFIQRPHLVFVDRERRTRLLMLRIFQRDHQAAAAFRQARIQFGGIATTHLRRQRDQRSAIEHAGAIGQQGRIERERIATDEFDVARDMMHAVARFAALRHQAVPGEESVDGHLRQLDAEHAISLRGQPCHVERLAGQGNEDPAPRGQRQRGPVLPQQRRHFILVEADLAFAPALFPEVSAHRTRSLRRPRRGARSRDVRRGDIYHRHVAHPPSANPAATTRRDCRAHRHIRQDP